jgi:hypothetical protein
MDGMTGGVAAVEAYDLEIVRPPRPSSWARWLGAVVVNLVAQSMAVENGGGRRARFTDRRTGAVLGEFVEPFGSNSSSSFTVVLSDYATMTAEVFETTWLRD